MEREGLLDGILSLGNSGELIADHSICGVVYLKVLVKRVNFVTLGSLMVVAYSAVSSLLLL